MSGLFGIFDIGKLAMQANQKAISVTSNNIANVNTPGYSRQEAIFETTPSEQTGAGPIGTGVQIGQIRQMVDKFLEGQIQSENSSLGGYQVDQNTLSRLESIFNDSQGTGLQQALGGFFSSLQDLANKPQGLTERTMVLSKAQILSQQFANAWSQMQDIRNNLNSDVAGTINTVNSLAARIAELNGRISQTEITGQQANDLRDQRGRLLNELADKIDISTFENSQGQMTVMITGGKPLVEGIRTNAIQGAVNPGNSGFLNIEFVPANGTPVDITSSIAGGRLKGLLDMRDNVVPGFMTQLDQLASAVITEVNLQHQAGFDLNGNAGGNFFAPTAPGASAAGTMAVAIAAPNLIAASSTAAGVPGDNGNALLLAQLQNKSVAALGSATFQDFYGNFAGQIGTQAQSAQWNLSAQKGMMQQLSARRESFSGVSLDEEMTNLMQYQRAFQASARLITSADEMMQTLLDMKR
ncbi:MAG: flagellar hook-associated protein FlgK [Nitrospirae bacterium]|nr:flagellar hook-associated protein FlgK [Nitrospirota bacterium]